MHSYHRFSSAKRAPRRRAPILLLIAGMAIAGCGHRLPVAPVEGKVSYQGKPLEFGCVTFQPSTGPPAIGMIKPDGAFRLSTYGKGDGAVIGKHAVQIACFETQRPGAPPPDPNQELGAGESLIPPKYSSIATSGLTREVKSKNEPFVFELTD